MLQDDIRLLFNQISSNKKLQFNRKNIDRNVNIFHVQKLITLFICMIAFNKVVP